MNYALLFPPIPFKIKLFFITKKLCVSFRGEPCCTGMAVYHGRFTLRLATCLGRPTVLGGEREREIVRGWAGGARQLFMFFFSRGSVVMLKLSEGDVARSC